MSKSTRCHLKHFSRVEHVISKEIINYHLIIPSQYIFSLSTARERFLARDFRGGICDVKSMGRRIRGAFNFLPSGG